MTYFINKHKQNKAVLRQATKLMRNLQKPIEFHTEVKDPGDKNTTEKCFSTDLEDQAPNRLLDFSVSSNEEYSDFTKNSNSKVEESQIANQDDTELLKNIHKGVKAVSKKPQEKPRLSLNHSAHILESSKNVVECQIGSKLIRKSSIYSDGEEKISSKNVINILDDYSIKHLDLDASFESGESEFPDAK